MPHDKRTLIALISGAVTLSTALTGIAFWLSYAHLAGIANTHGAGATERGWAWPATIDLFIAIGEIGIVISFMTGARMWPSIGLTTLGTLGSIAVNVSGVGMNRHPLDYVVAAIPPVAAGLAFGVLMGQVHAYLKRRPNTPQHPANTPEQAHVPQPNTHEQAALEDATPPNTDPYADLISGKELALILGVKDSTIRGYVMKGRLTPAATHPTRGNLFRADQRPAAA